MKALCIVLIALLLLSGCYSTPQVSGSSRVEEGKYQIFINRDYANIPEEFKYAVNSWVKENRGESYDVERAIKGPVTDIYVIMPGSQPVEDLPEVKHLHKGKTVTAIVVPTSIFTFILLLVAASRSL